MRVIFTGLQRTGAVVMRGEQIAERRQNWSAIAKPSLTDLESCDVLFVIKKPDFGVLELARKMKIPIVYDALDFWRQSKPKWRRPNPDVRISGVGEARRLFRKHFDAINPDLIICVTRKMADDLSVFAPTAWVPHHADSRLPNAEAYHDGGSANALLYFGARPFLQEWERRIRRVCSRQGVDFVICNTGTATEFALPPARAMIAVRGGHDGCWLARNWKSNVKAATAARLGLPLVAWPEAAYIETAPEAYWFTNAAELEAAVESAMSPEARPVATRFTAEDTARAYEDLLAEHFGLSPADT